jgi:glycerate kinase
VRTVVIAPDSFKGSLSARSVAEAIAEGWRSERSDDRLVLLPQADGGEGTLDAIAASVPGAVRHAAPLLGPTGAAAVFGPQKGASPAQIAELDAALSRFADLLGGDPAAPGAGAAGGTAYGFAAAWGATIVSGADYIAEVSGVPAALLSADVLITGEGRFDEQSLTGKVVGQLLGVAARAGVRAGVIAGQVGTGATVWTASLTELAGSVEAAIAEPATWLRHAGALAAREF